MLKWIILGFAVRLLFLTSCTSTVTSVSKRGNTVQICGRMLVETLNLLCQGQYYDPGEENMISKRYVPELPGGKVYSLWLFGMPSTQNKEFGRQEYYPNSRLRRGVADECCSQPCSVSVLMSYCRFS